MFAGDVINSLIAPLAPLKDAQNARVFDTSTDQPDLNTAVVVWIIIPDGTEKVLGPLAGAILRVLYEKAKKVPNTVRFVVDEAGSCLAFDELEQYVSVAAGQGVYFALVLQSVSQLAAKIRAENTEGVINNTNFSVWGASTDDATRRKVVDLSGTTDVYHAEFEHAGWERKWRQAIARDGAPYKWKAVERPKIKREHLSLPRFWFYEYENDPATMRLVIIPPLFTYEDQIMPKKRRPQLVGIPRKQLPPPEPTVFEPAPDPGCDDPDEAPRNDQGETPSLAPSFSPPTYIPPTAPSGQGQGRRCEACENIETGEAAEFCSRCGSRLPPQRKAG